MNLTAEQEQALKEAIDKIEYGEIVIKATGGDSFVDIVVSRRERLYATNKNKNIKIDRSNEYKKG